MPSALSAIKRLPCPLSGLRTDAIAITLLFLSLGFGSCVAAPPEEALDSAKSSRVARCSTPSSTAVVLYGAPWSPRALELPTRLRLQYDKVIVIDLMTWEVMTNWVAEKFEELTNLLDPPVPASLLYQTEGFSYLRPSSGALRLNHFFGTTGFERIFSSIKSELQNNKIEINMGISVQEYAKKNGKIDNAHFFVVQPMASSIGLESSHNFYYGSHALASTFSGANSSLLDDMAAISGENSVFFIDGTYDFSSFKKSIKKSAVYRDKFSVWSDDKLADLYERKTFAGKERTGEWNILPVVFRPPGKKDLIPLDSNFFYPPARRDGEAYRSFGQLPVQLIVVEAK